MTDHPSHAKLVTIGEGGQTPLSALLMKPRRASACFIFAHGAGAGMSHAFMHHFATSLYDRGIATLRFQFPYMDEGRRRLDPPPVAHAAVRAAVAEARKRCRGLPLIAGGKSFGGRMTSQAQAIMTLRVDGIAFIGFPLHPSGKPSQTRAEHLGNIHIPMLFIQGTRDKLAKLSFLRLVVKRLRKRATLHLVDQADHGFHVPVRSGRTDLDVVCEIVNAFVDWRLKKIVE